MEMDLGTASRIPLDVLNIVHGYSGPLRHNATKIRYNKVILIGPAKAEIDAGYHQSSYTNICNTITRINKRQLIIRPPYNISRIAFVIESQGKNITSELVKNYNASAIPSHFSNDHYDIRQHIETYFGECTNKKIFYLNFDRPAPPLDILKKYNITPDLMKIDKFTITFNKTPNNAKLTVWYRQPITIIIEKNRQHR
jgi:hypothetical protein